MTEPFANIVLPVFQRVTELLDRLSWGEKPSLDEVMKQTRSWIESAEQKAHADRDLAEDYELSKYGLVGWIDEVLTNSEWGRSVGWGDQLSLLEWDLYKSRLSGDKFYQEADIAEAHADNGQGVDALEAYLLCVALGFRGRLASHEEQFTEWVNRVSEKIRRGNPMASRPFEEEDVAPPELQPLQGPQLLFRVSVLVAITAIVTLFSYIAAVHIDYGPST